MSQSISAEEFHKQFSGKGKARVKNYTRRKPGEMNRMEAEWEQVLLLRKSSGQVQDFKFESVKMRLADLTWYTPDFCVINQQGEVEFHDVKGNLVQDDAKVKMKVFAEMYPHVTLRVVTQRRKKDGGGWLLTTVGTGEEEVIGG